MIPRQYLKFYSSTRRLLFLHTVNNQLPMKIPYNRKLIPDIFSNSIFRSSNTCIASTEIKHIDQNITINNNNDDIQKPINQEELLNKLIAALSSDIHKKNRVYKKDILKILNIIKESNFSTNHHALLLISCCTELLPDESASMRMNLVEQVWKTLLPHTKFLTDHYNELLKVYIANNRTLNVNTFIQQMDPMKPNIVTYELILQALAEAGDVNQASEVIANMKSQNIPVTENIFNSFILCQGKSRNLNNINETLKTMKSLHIEKSVDTYTAVIKAMVWNKKSEQVFEEMENARRNGWLFSETHIMDIVKTLAYVGLYSIIPKVLTYLPKKTLQTPSISPYMQNVATVLVYMNQPMAALEIYKCLPLPLYGTRDNKGLHGRSLVRDCVKASLPASVISLVAQELMSSGRNPIAIQNACEAALLLGKVPLAIDFFTRMKQMGLPLRPHYFWPILIHNSKTYGEKGIMNTLASMSSMEVKPDYDTILYYTLPYVSFNSPQNLMKKFLESGLTVSTVLTPMMEILLSSGQVKAASELSQIFKGTVDSEKLLKPLLKGYLTSLDLNSTMIILEDICVKTSEKGKDWVGRFLCEFTNSNKFKEDISDFRVLVKALQYTTLRISTAATDYCLTKFSDKYPQETLENLRNSLIAITDEKLTDDSEMYYQMKHPSKMNDEQLQSHLIELESKGMNTRGVLRKLLQMHCRKGNLTAAKEILNRCQREGVFLSAGMKASVFEMYVKLGELDLAEKSLADLNKTSPNFTLDDFKVIDFATLMVYRKKLDRAFDLIVEQSKNRHVTGGRGIEGNCWRLLDALAANGSPEYVHEMFLTLLSYGYCKPTNVILGPLIRVYMKTDNIEKAVEEFIKLSGQYKKTPLKHELLCKILKKMSDGQSEENFVFNEKANCRLNKLAQTILNIDKEIHGVSAVQTTIIAALSEVGYKKTLRRVLTDPNMKFHPDAILRRCERFASEGKLIPLENIAECARDVRHIKVDAIYDMMLDVLQREDNTQGALSLWYRLQEADIIPTQKFIQNLCALLKSNNKAVPPEITTLLDKHAKNKIINS